MDKRKERFRLAGLTALMLVLIAVFFTVLYDLQIIRRDEFLTRTVKAIGSTETVPAARGEISDRYGRSLVTNQVVYQVTLDTAIMGDRRQEILLELIDVADGLDVRWPDSLPLSKAPPYGLTLDTASSAAQSNFAALRKSMGWSAGDDAAPLAKLREYYKVDPDLSDARARPLVGILYELSLRSKEVLWSPYVFASGVDIDFISQVRERGLNGVIVSPVSTRKYATTYAAHILGRTGAIQKSDWDSYKALGYAMNETVGQDGVEKAFESILRGRAGTQVVERSTTGKLVSRSWKEEPSPGANVCLTLDLPLQQKVEDTLAQKLPTLTEDVRGGAAVVLDVHSGAVLAMASYPTYDLTAIYKDAALYKQAVEDPLHPFNNRATQGLYPPGSTFKMLVAIGALEEGVIEPNTLIRDTGTYDYYQRNGPACWIWRDYRSTHGLINVSKAIEVSCNVFFYDVGRRLGIDRINDYARRFGLGQPTGIEIPERTGVVAGPDYTESQGQVWYEGSVLSAAIGQENNQFTPLQLAGYTAAIANGGTHYAAHLLQSVKSPDWSETLMEYEPQVLDSIPISPENLEAVKSGMLSLTTSGSVSGYFRGLPFRVGAKTGSAQVAGSTSNAVFVCFAPYDDPQIALALVAEQGGSGSSLGELAADILQFYFANQTPSTPAVEENTLLR